MEHRYSKRHSADIQALIFKSGLPIAIGRVRNMSKHGIFIDCAPQAAALNQPLGIELFSYGNRVGKSNRFACFVAHKETHGLGLCLFDDCQFAYARYVESVLAKLKAVIAIPCAVSSPREENLNAAAQVYLHESA
jgi:hypothetical protein